MVAEKESDEKDGEPKPKKRTKQTTSDSQPGNGVAENGPDGKRRSESRDCLWR